MDDPSANKKKKKARSDDKATLPSQTLASVGLGMAKNVPNSKIVRIENLTYSKYTAGVVCYGYILQLNDSSAVVSLPGGVTGTIAHSEVSDVCHALMNQHGADAKVILIRLSIKYCYY